VRFVNALIARDMAIQKVFAFVNRDASSAQKAIQLLTAHVGKNLTILSACCAKATIQLIIKVIRIYKSVPTFWRKMVTPESQPLNLQAYKLD
jgi:hypothetical protein